MTTAEKCDMEEAEREAAKELLEPGIYFDVPAARYHQIPAVSSHVLKGFFRTPAHAREEMERPFEQTPAMKVGEALHRRVLELDSFALHYIVPPTCPPGVKANQDGTPNKTTTEGKEVWAAWEGRARGRTVLTHAEMDQVDGMARSIERHPFGSELLRAEGRNEVTVIWPEIVGPHGDEVEVICKARLDAIRTQGETTYLLDLKTAQDASEREFERAVANFRYAHQMGWYVRGYRYHTQVDPIVAFVAVEKQRPYCVSVMQLDPEDCRQGEREAVRNLETLVHCRRTGVYPGYSEGMGYVGLPPWAREGAAPKGEQAAVQE